MLIRAKALGEDAAQIFVKSNRRWEMPALDQEEAVKFRQGKKRQDLWVCAHAGYLINVARGSVVEEAALIEALQNKTIAGAALDVYVDEPRVHEALRALPNVVLTPHMASGTTETRKAMSDLCLANLQAHLAGTALLTPVPECRT